MKIVLSTLMALGVVMAPVAAPTVAFASNEVAIACPADAPDSWKRPGGYCEQIESLKSIAPNGSGEGGCMMITMAAPMMVNGRVLVAAIDPCCNLASIGPSTFDLLPEGVLSRTDESPALVATPCPR